MSDINQSYANHNRYDPLFHFFLTPGSVLIFAFAVRELMRDPTAGSFVRLFGVIWITVAVFKMRLYALKVQDRVIRLEERLRLKDVLPSDLAGRAAELSVDQLVGLRFASDAELPGLVEKALSSKLDRKQIKQLVQRWRADTWRV